MNAGRKKFNSLRLVRRPQTKTDVLYLSSSGVGWPLCYGVGCSRRLSVVVRTLCLECQSLLSYPSGLCRPFFIGLLRISISFMVFYLSIVCALHAADGIHSKAASLKMPFLQPFQGDFRRRTKGVAELPRSLMAKMAVRLANLGPRRTPVAGPKMAELGGE